MTSRAMSRPLSDSFSTPAASILGAAVAINVIVIATSVCQSRRGRARTGRVRCRPAGCSLRVASLEERDARVLIQLRYLGRVGLRDEARPGVDRAERVLAVANLERGDLHRVV